MKNRINMYSKAKLPHIGQEYHSIFDTMYPYKEMRRYIVDRISGKVLHSLNKESDWSTYDPIIHDVMVKIPAFYYKIRGQKDNLYIEVADYNDELLYKSFASGFVVHPAFIDNGGNIIPYIMVGAFLASEDSVSHALRSIPDALPIVNMDVKTLARKAGEKSHKWSIMDSRVYNALFILYINEYKTLDIQSVLGKGCTECPSLLPHITGDTKNLFVSGYTGINGRNSMSYRGIEDFYGNIYMAIADLYFDKYCTLYHSSNKPHYGDKSRYHELTEYSSSLYIPREPNLSPDGFNVCKSNPYIILPSTYVNSMDTYHKDEFMFISEGFLSVGGNTMSSYKAGIFNAIITTNMNMTGTRLVLYP